MCLSAFVPGLYIQVEARDLKSSIFPRHPPPYFWRQSLSLRWRSSIWRGRLASQLQGSSFLCLRSTGITGTCPSVQLFTWMLKVLTLAWPALHPLSHPPAPVKLTFKLDYMKPQWLPFFQRMKSDSCPSLKVALQCGPDSLLPLHS